jgi:hypothetical protein
VGMHDGYGKKLMKQIKGFRDTGDTTIIGIGGKNYARIDGTISDQVAVEIESRVFKQIRGAILDLLLHNYPKKLLILLPVHMSNPFETADKCHAIMSKFLDVKDFQVLLLKGTGLNPQEAKDLELIRNSLDNLNI